ncbi:MAG: hypothetical protein Hyperionvirus14_47 [Hyperionvirus sp.]|uniref:Uncharacterized protein n=1 Tax=Hyperionvirus sp. TaxID=2487770 RepID=A0A3G5A9L1_9VIRU|nr:MAG: hypothetical protein Hyperionvirus14_47 [Hyperionvirus sp.]
MRFNHSVGVCMRVGVILAMSMTAAAAGSTRCDGFCFVRGIDGSDNGFDFLFRLLPNRNNSIQMGHAAHIQTHDTAKSDGNLI